MSVEDDRIRQIQGALQLLQAGVDRGSRRIEEMHLAIAKKPFGVLRRVRVVNLAAGVVEKIHDGVTHGVHAAIRGANETLVTTAIMALDLAKMDGPPDIDDDHRIPPLARRKPGKP
jgi:hypothetical protein